MYRIDNATAVAVIPVPAAIGPNPNCYFFKGNPGGGIPATIVDDDWANAVQEEICNVIVGAGIALDKTVRTQLLSALTGGKLGRTRLTANTSFYVLSTGSNLNNGLANTAGGAWLTLQFALDSLRDKYDLAGFQATVNVGAGTFAGGAASNQLGINNPIIINGVGATTIFNTNVGATGGMAFVQIQNCKFVCPADNAIVAGSGGTTYIGAGVEFGATGASFAQIYANNASILILANYTISGAGCLSHLRCFSAGKIIFNSVLTVTLTGTPAYSIAFADSNSVSLINSQSGVTWTGAATGVRYGASNNALILTGSGASATYFPGNSAGSVNSGGVYN